MAHAYVEVPLTQGKVALVDPEDYETLIAEGRWFAGWTGWSWYAGRNARGDSGRVQIRMHGYLTGFPLTDHVNGDSLDNRRANLRTASTSQNGANRPAQRNNTSGYKGVTRDSADNVWRAQITVNRRHLSLGRFPTPEEAAQAYDRAALLHFGEFAYQNFEAVLVNA